VYCSAAKSVLNQGCYWNGNVERQDKPIAPAQGCCGLVKDTATIFSHNLKQLC
jgi:hypothetical protein